MTKRQVLAFHNLIPDKVSMIIICTLDMEKFYISKIWEVLEYFIASNDAFFHFNFNFS